MARMGHYIGIISDTNGCQMKTEFALLAVYNSPLIPLKDFARDILGIQVQTAKNQLSAGTFPVPVTRTGKFIMVHVEDAARFIDECREKRQAS